MPNEQIPKVVMKEYSVKESFLDEFLVEESIGKYQDLEERGLQFAKSVRDFVKKVDRSFWNNEYMKQLIRASASVGANYIEANEYLGDKDFLMKVRTSRREAKESKYWLRLIDIENKPELQDERKILVQEADELKRIFSSIIIKRSKN